MRKGLPPALARKWLLRPGGSASGAAGARWRLVGWVWEQQALAPRVPRCAVHGVQREGCCMPGGGRQPPAPCPPLLPCLCWPPAPRARAPWPPFLAPPPLCCSAPRLPKRGKQASNFIWAYAPTLQSRPTSECAGQRRVQRGASTAPARPRAPAAFSQWLGSAGRCHLPTQTHPAAPPTHQALQDGGDVAATLSVRGAGAHRLPQKVWSQCAVCGGPRRSARALLPLPPQLGGAPPPLAGCWHLSAALHCACRPCAYVRHLDDRLRCQAARCQLPAASGALMVAGAASPLPAGRHL